MKNTRFIPSNSITFHNEMCSYNIVLLGNNAVLLTKTENGDISILISKEILQDFACGKVLEIGTFSGQKCGVIEVEENFDIDNNLFEVKLIRESLALINSDELNALSRAIEFKNWLSKRKYCGSCGALLEDAQNETAKICPACKNRFYPVLAPAVIVAITRGNQILLAHNHRFKENLYSLIAGFVESGETLEHAVKREVFEEVGLHVKNIKYFSSQTWPFPNSLMMGFTAEFESGEIKIDQKELADAAWYDFDKLPLIPNGETIARRLIDHVTKK